MMWFPINKAFLIRSRDYGRRRGKGICPRPILPVRSKGFTLVEVLMVVLIMSILAGVVLGLAGYAARMAALAKARSQMEKLKLGLENYRAEWGAYPQSNTVSGLIEELYFDPIKNNQRVYIEFDEKELVNKTLLDPWGKEYRYVGDEPIRNPDSYDLSSAGPDQKNGTDDDLKNW